MTYRPYGHGGRLPYRKYSAYDAVNPTLSFSVTTLWSMTSGQVPVQLAPGGTGLTVTHLEVTRKVKNVKVEVLPNFSASDYYLGHVAFLRWPVAEVVPTSWVDNADTTSLADSDKVLFWDRRVLRPSMLTRNGDWQAPHLAFLPQIDIRSTDRLHCVLLNSFIGGAPNFQVQTSWVELEVPE